MRNQPPQNLKKYFLYQCDSVEIDPFSKKSKSAKTAPPRLQPKTDKPRRRRSEGKAEMQKPRR
jgi:hypothetical protein